jgi:hypothetical protein
MEMSGLKEKASQGCYHCSCCSHYHGIAKGCDLPECAFVPRKLLEDAQKEVDELKQKLQRLIDELKLRPSELGTLCSTYQEGWLDAMVLAILKFEELLKEVEQK